MHWGFSWIVADIVPDNVEYRRSDSNDICSTNDGRLQFYRCESMPKVNLTKVVLFRREALPLNNRRFNLATESFPFCMFCVCLGRSIFQEQQKWMERHCIDKAIPKVSSKSMASTRNRTFVYLYFLPQPDDNMQKVYMSDMPSTLVTIL